MKNLLNTQVSFDDPLYGPQTGVVTGVLTDIGNGQAHAVVSIDHELPGIVSAVPVVDLQIATSEEEALTALRKRMLMRASC